MAELVDALVSGTSGRKAVQVRPLFRAQKEGGFHVLPLFVPVASLRISIFRTLHPHPVPRNITC